MIPVRIEIDLSAANDAEAHRWLDRILHKIEDGWHIWDVAAVEGTEEFKASSWMRDQGSQGQRARELFVASVQRSAWTSAPHGRRVRVTIRPTGMNDLEPRSAAGLAEEPLVILVENRLSDGAFVRRVVAGLDKALNNIWHRPGKPIRIDSLGGTGQMAGEVARRVENAPYRPRLVAIIDSDRKGPNDSESPTARSLRNRCDELGVPCWMLAKREAENYLPRELLDAKPDAGVDHARQAEAWARLGNDQKDFFDMKNGLPDELSAVETALFGNLTPSDRAILSHGFGGNLYKCWECWTVQSASALRKRGRGDLERGIKLIRAEV